MTARKRITRSRLVWRLIGLSTLTLLTACGGGGGGGASYTPRDLSGGSPVAKKATVAGDIFGDPLKAALNDHEVVVVGLGGGSEAAILLAGGDTIKFTSRNIDMNGSVPVASANIHRNGLVTASQGRIGLVLGGKSEKITGGLEYSNFGYVLPEKGSTAAQVGVPFYFGDGGNIASMPNAGGNFTGAAVATAFKTNTVVPLVGAASLAVAAGGNSGSLTLDFNNFYKLTAAGLTTNSGVIEGPFTEVAAATNGANNTGIDLITGPVNPSDYDLNLINGQAYGPAGGATEAVGNFALTANTGAGVTGAFGVK